MAARTSPPVRLAIFVFALLAVFGLGAAPASADVDDFAFDSFHADMSLTRGADGHAELAVVETIVARFPDEDQNRGIVRAIPDDADGVPLDTRIVSVTSGDGTAIPHEVDDTGDFVGVATGDDSFVRGVQTYVIAYTQRDSIRAFADTGADEFYRDINGTGWAQPFGEVSATVVVAADLTDALTGGVACYVGAEGSTDTCTLDERGEAGEPRQFYPQAYDLAAGENVTVAIGFEPGTFVPGEVQRNALEEFGAGPGPQIGSIVAVVAALAAAAGAFFARRRTRDAAGRGVIVAEYDPPRDVSVMQAAHLVNRPATAIPAAIIDLAVHRHLRIIARGDATVSLEYLSPSDDPARQRVLDALFEFAAQPGARAFLGGESREVATSLAALSASSQSELRSSGFTRKRSHAAHAIAFTVALLAFVLALFSLIVAAIGGALSVRSILALVVAIAVGALVIATWRTHDQVTDQGAGVRDHLLGLRDYLQLAEADRIRMLQSPDGAERSPEGVVHLYEKLLPYAVVWGIEREWVDVLAAYATDADAQFDWYRGPGGFSSAQFAATLAATRTATAPPAQTWSSSGGSSFSGGSMGGGFSGGGMGGGGGGGR